jgi:saccharopine dehydrogenase (NAD+, L-lysine-forming)
MTHLWVRAEERENERRVAVTPGGVAELIAAGLRVTVEESADRALPLADYRAAGAEIAPRGSWREAPRAALILGLKELPDDATPLPHRHIMFGHAYKGQPAGKALLRRFAEGGGTLLDLEYLVDGGGRRLAAFGFWAGFAGAAVSLKCWTAQQRGGICPPVDTYASQQTLLQECEDELDALGTGLRPEVLIIGAQGRVGAGATEFCRLAGLPPTLWDMAETAHGGPFPEVRAHPIFLNCILARPGAPVFVPDGTETAPRALRVIGDIACDPTSDFSPVKVYDRATTWAAPALRVHDAPPLDVMAIDNLPSLLPVESSENFAGQLLPVLKQLPDWEAGADGPWARAAADFHRHAPKQPA